jgi:hypothetical protein
MLPLEIHDLDWDSTKHDEIKPFMEYQPSSYDVDEDKDCEKQEDHSKRFHRFNREHRSVVLVIGTVIICIVIVSIVGVW